MMAELLQVVKIKEHDGFEIYGEMQTIKLQERKAELAQQFPNYSNSEITMEAVAGIVPLEVFEESCWLQQHCEEGTVEMDFRDPQTLMPTAISKTPVID